MLYLLGSEYHVILFHQAMIYYIPCYVVFAG